MPNKPRAKPPRVRAKSVFKRGPKELQLSLQTPKKAPYGEMPTWFMGRYPAASLPEWAFYWAHLAIGRKDGLDFVYQSPAAGGRLEFGGRVLDFQELDQPLFINIQGDYWHSGASKLAEDRATRTLMGNYGYRLLFAGEWQVLDDPIYILREALNGIEHYEYAA